MEPSDRPIGSGAHGLSPLVFMLGLIVFIALVAIFS